MPLFKLSENPKDMAERNKGITAVAETLSHLLPSGADFIVPFLANALAPDTEQEVLEATRDSVVDTANPMALFHGTSSNNIESIFRRGIAAVRDRTKFGANPNKRMAAFATPDRNIAENFANMQRATVNRRTHNSFRDRELGPILQEGLNIKPEEVPIVINEMTHYPDSGINLILDELGVKNSNIEFEVYKSLEKAIENYLAAPQGTGTKSAVVEILDDALKELPNFRDTHFPSENAILFPEGIPPEFIRGADILDFKNHLNRGTDYAVRHLDRATANAGILDNFLESLRLNQRSPTPELSQSISTLAEELQSIFSAVREGFR